MFLFFPAPWSAKAEITRPKVLRDLEENYREGEMGHKEEQEEEVFENRIQQDNREAKKSTKSH